MAQKKLSAWMKDRQITLTAYSPLGSGDRPRKNDFDKVLLQDPLVAKIAAKYNKTPAQILLR